MKGKLNRFMKGESGITALETAIILIAFVVVAAVFAFTVLSTGTFLTERSKEAAYAGLQEVRGSMELKGSIVLDDTKTNESLVLNLATVSGGSSVDLSKVKITYRDSSTNSSLTYDTGATDPATSHWIAVDAASPSTALQILPTGGLAMLIVAPPSALSPNQTFALEVKPQTGGVLLLERTTPAQIDSVTDLH
jgi:flagellin FlaB